MIKLQRKANVQLRITVNRDGDVINAKVIGSANTANKDLALKKIRDIKFNKSETASATQFGVVIFSFRTTNK